MRAALLGCLILAAHAAVPNSAYANGRGDEPVHEFATLPADLRFPEGITANPATGDVYVATFDFLRPASNKLLRYSRHGQLVGTRDMAAAMLGLAFGPRDAKLYIANFGASKIQRVRADLGGALEDVATLPVIGPPADRSVANPDGSADTIKFGSNGFPVPNAMVFDRSGNLYVSDSFQGAIFRIDNAQGCVTPCGVNLVAHDPLLATAGFPPFGANGLAFSLDELTLFVANTGDDRVLKLDLATQELGVLAESINGADGLTMDRDGILWVAANQGDQIVGLNEHGRVVATIGEFDGIGADGAPVGLLFPASMVIVGRDMFVTNLALPLTDAIGDEPEEDVTRWTVSRVHLARHAR